MKKISTIFVVLALMVSVAAASYYYWIQHSASQLQNYNHEEVLPHAQEKEQITPVEEVVAASEVLTLEEQVTALAEEAIAVEVTRPQNEGWQPIASFFDENQLLKKEFYSSSVDIADLNKLPFPTKQISDFKWSLDYEYEFMLPKDKAKYKDECIRECLFVKDKFIGSYEKISFSGAFILKDHLIEVFEHRGSGAYMPSSFAFVKIDTAGNAELISDDHASMEDQLARVGLEGFEIDLRPYMKLQYFLTFNENGLHVTSHNNRTNIETKTCKKYYAGTLEACPMLYECVAEDVVQALARAYAGDVMFSMHDQNVDEKKFNKLCAKVCRKEQVSYQEFENELCRVH